MGYSEKAKNQAQQMKGKAKEWVGDKTNNERMQAEGAQDQASARGQGGDQMKDTNKDMPGR